MSAQEKAAIELRNIRKSFGSVDVIHNLSLQIAGGEFVVFVGPSGCGKSTMLRMIAGLEEVSEGDILIAGQDVTDLDPAKRGIAMVFQSYALYPHMSVRENLAFGLEIAKMPSDEIKRQVSQAADILKIGPLLDRRPGQLSGGQRQRVAIGRAIVRKPQVFLFDEPLSNLDAELRVSMRVEIARLHRELGNTMIYVTHDQTEAMTLADRIVVLRDGIIEQVGTPREIYENPANLFVGGFIGSPRMNIIDAVCVGNNSIRIGQTIVPITGEIPAREGELVKIGIRPEHWVIGGAPGTSLRAQVEFAEYLGNTSYLHCKIDSGDIVTLERRGANDLRSGDRISIGIDVARIKIFSSDNFNNK